MIPAGSPNTRNVFPVVVQCGDRSSLLPFFPSYPPSFNLVFIKHLLYAKQLFKVSASHFISSQTSPERSTNSAPLWLFRVFSWCHHLLSSLVLCLVLPSSSSAQHPTNCQLCISNLAPSFYPPVFISLLDTRASSQLVSLPPGYHSIRGSVDSPAHTQNYVIPIVSII